MDIIDKKTQSVYKIIIMHIIGIFAVVSISLIVGINVAKKSKKLEIENQELVAKITEIKDSNKKFLTELNQTIINYLNAAYEQSEQQTNEEDSISGESK